MTKFLSYFNLCTINNVKDFLGLSPDNEDGSIINTFEKNMIIITKLSNQKQIGSWTVLERLTNKVAYDFLLKQYVGVFLKRFIRVWDKTCTDINKIKLRKLKKNIHDIFTINEHLSTLILYEDGTCESLESAIETKNITDNIVEEVLPVKNGCLISNVTFIENQNKPVITYFVTNPISNSIELIYFTLEKRNLKPIGKISNIQIKRYEAFVKPVSYVVVNCSSTKPSLFTIWSDERIFMQQIDFKETGINQDIGKYVALFKALKIDKPFSVLPLNEDYIVMYGQTQGQDGSTLLLYNTKFKLVQTKQSFKIYFDNSRLWCFGSNIFLGAGQILSVIPYRISKEHLSDLVGSQCSSVTSHYVDTEYINEEDEIEENMRYNPNKMKEYEMIRHYQVVDEPADVAEIISKEGVELKLKNLYRKKLCVDFIADETIDVLNFKLFSSVDKDILFSEVFELFVSELEKGGASEFEITERVCPLIIDVESLNDLRICFRRYNNISEKMLVTSLNYVINLLIGKSNINWEKDECVDLLNVLLSCTYNRENMLPYMKEYLDLTTVIFLLNYLQKLITDENEKLKETPATADNFNPELIIINWIGLILDSHYQNLILTNDKSVLDVLITSQNTLKTITEEILEIKQLVPVLKNIVRGKYFGKEKRYSKWYSIEKVKLY